jgi:SSS family solute:Na+ symporter
MIIDYLIIAIYFVFVIFIGFILRTKVKTSKAFFLAGRSNPSWISGLAFISANMGALELLGMCAGAYEYGFMQVHFYWLGAVPAILLLALFMMPLYYGPKVHSVPEYLKLRYNEATRGLNALTFVLMTLLLSGKGLSDYKIARKINTDPPSVTRSRKNAHKKLQEAETDIECAKKIGKRPSQH